MIGETIKGLVLIGGLVWFVYKLCKTTPQTAPEQPEQPEQEEQAEQANQSEPPVLSPEERQAVCDAIEPAAKELVRLLTERRNTEQLHAAALMGDSITIHGGGIYSKSTGSDAVQTMLLAQIAATETAIVEQVQQLHDLLQNPTPTQPNGHE